MKINISIDDVSPHPLSSVKVLDRCYELIQEFPDIKFSLFIPIAYWRTTRQDIATKYPLRIDAYPEFCKVLDNLPEKNFELCYHGLFHGIPGKSDNDEFQNISKEEAIEKFVTMFEITKKANLIHKFKPIFRPPAWRMSPGAIIAAKEIGIKVLALSPKDYAKKTYAGEENNFLKVVYYNYNPPFDELKEIVDEYNEIVYHACEWDKNYFSKHLCNQLVSWLHSNKNIEFKFLEDMK